MSAHVALARPLPLAVARRSSPPLARRAASARTAFVSSVFASTSPRVVRRRAPLPPLAAGDDDDPAVEGGWDDTPTPPSDPDPVSSEDASASSPLGDLISSPLFYVTFGIVGGVAVVQRFENAALLLSAFPIVGLTLLSKTDFGANLERNILDRRPALEAIARETERAREAARERSPLYSNTHRHILRDS